MKQATNTRAPTYTTKYIHAISLIHQIAQKKKKKNKKGVEFKYKRATLNPDKY